jgi:lysylphosphatidylglycerol synthetase-like protein (DUF2156 family)
MNKKWMPITTGVLDIGVGVVGTYAGLIISIFGLVLYSGPRAAYQISGPLHFIIGVVVIVSGIYAFKRKKWDLVLAGPIIALILCTAHLILNYIYTYSYLEQQYIIVIIPALVAIVLTILSRKQFEK